MRRLGDCTRMAEEIFRTGWYVLGSVGDLSGFFMRRGARMTESFMPKIIRQMCDISHFGDMRKIVFKNCLEPDLVVFYKSY